MYYPVCGILHIKDPLLLIEKTNGLLCFFLLECLVCIFVGLLVISVVFNLFFGVFLFICFSFTFFIIIIIIILGRE